MWDYFHLILANEIPGINYMIIAVDGSLLLWKPQKITIESVVESCSSKVIEILENNYEILLNIDINLKNKSLDRFVIFAKNHSKKRLPKEYYKELANWICGNGKEEAKSEAKLYSLTKREGECLRWSELGKTSWEMSLILGISERTINFHIINAIKKTKSINRQQAITKCFVLNII